MAATDKSLLAAPTGSSHLKKLVIDAPSTSDQPKVVDIDAPPPPPTDDLEVEEVEPSLADLMMGDALQNKAERAAKTAKEEKRMKKSFGAGMKKGLKKGFLGGGTIANFVQQGVGSGRFFSARRWKEGPEGASLGAAPSRFFSKRCGRAGTARAMKSIENKPRRVPKPWQNHPREIKNHPKRVPKPSQNLPREVQGGSWDPSGPQ